MAIFLVQKKHENKYETQTYGIISMVIERKRMVFKNNRIYLLKTFLLWLKDATAKEYAIYYSDNHYRSIIKK